MLLTSPPYCRNTNIEGIDIGTGRTSEANYHLSGPTFDS